MALQRETVQFLWNEIDHLAIFASFLLCRITAGVYLALSRLHCSKYGNRQSAIERFSTTFPSRVRVFTISILQTLRRIAAQTTAYRYAQTAQQVSNNVSAFVSFGAALNFSTEESYRKANRQDTEIEIANPKESRFNQRRWA